MYGLHRPWRGWDLRLTGALFAQLIVEPNDKHRTGGPATWEIDSVNWGMFMMRRSVGAGRFGVRAMMSAEPVTIPGCGAINLLATGEICEKDTIHDRQQPHDLFMELSADYDRPLAGAWSWQVYAGLAGEPALGPAGYLHRESAMDNSIQPISHHWLDSTHIAFGVITAGLHNQRWKAEASVFHGREPDESRADLDLGAFDSLAARVSFLPTDRLAVQVSAGRLQEPTTIFAAEAQEPLNRITASATYHRPIRTTGFWATTAAFGLNQSREFVAGTLFDITSHATLLESSVALSTRHSVFGRFEFVDMPAHHLHAHEYLASVFGVAKAQLGYARHFAAVKGLVPGIGGSVSISFLPEEYAPRYEGSTATGFNVFINLRPARHVM